MSSEEYEFSQLVKKYIQGKEYEKAKYSNDTPDNQDIAGKVILKTVRRMSELWIQMTDSEREKYIAVL